MFLLLLQEEFTYLGDIIGAVGTVAGAVIGVVLGKRYNKEKKEKKELEVKVKEFDSYIEENNKRIPKIINDYASYVVGTLKKEIRVNSEGKGVLKSSILDFQFNRRIKDVPVPFKYLFDENFATVSKPKNIKGIGRVINPPEYREREVYVPEKNNSLKLIPGVFILKGHYSSKDNGAGFSFEQNLENPFLESQEEVKASYGSSDFAFEYYSIDIKFPVKRLLIIIKFSQSIKDFAKKPSVINFLTDTFCLNENETDRVESGIEIDYDLNEVKLEVRDPIPGHEYYIYWMPPLKKK